MLCSFLRRSEAQASPLVLPQRRKSSKAGSKPNRRHPQRASTPIEAPASEISCTETQTLRSDPAGAATRSPPTTSWWTDSVHNWMSSSPVAPNVACKQRYKFLRFVCLPWISGSQVARAPSDTPRFGPVWTHLVRPPADQKYQLPPRSRPVPPGCGPPLKMTSCFALCSLLDANHIISARCLLIPNCVCSHSPYDL